MGLILFFLFGFCCLVHAVTVLPTNQSQHLADHPVHFRLRGSGPLNGQALAPLTSNLANLPKNQYQVRFPQWIPAHLVPN